ncbi:unnamed protein product [Paramecium primaurelia]|uniref:Uncharacterized protein n=2 Tax=Paramecium TaxID=5884 RepID=A0A8S1MG83_PARPR|nr:unnamed protein product [Paramecium primaurelia]CAD8076697.1 unnamed protein product [Paramecium primaurelia]CAD8214166.1 unnamed protein product [Paramecium pentaurelia]
MPLYELIAICRCSQAQGTAAAIRQLSVLIFQGGGNIRNVRILGDRIMSKQIIGNDGFRHMIGRYVSILYDGHPSKFRNVLKGGEKSFEIFRLQHFRIKDFIPEAVGFTKPFEEEAPFVKNNSVQSYEYGRALQILREEKQKLS